MRALIFCVRYLVDLQEPLERIAHNDVVVLDGVDEGMVRAAGGEGGCTRLSAICLEGQRSPRSRGKGGGMHATAVNF